MPMSPDEMADLSALADGTLPDERRAEVEARVAASPELRELLKRQRQAVVAVQALADDPVPPQLQSEIEARVEALATKRGRSRRRVPRFVVVGAAAVAAVVVAAVALTGGPGSPTVADAARLAAQPPTGPRATSGRNVGDTARDRRRGRGVPRLRERYGWRASGVRRGRIDGRDATVVFYAKDGMRLAYVIVAGAGLSRPSGTQAGVVRQSRVPDTPTNNEPAGVTWRRGGHTCVLVGDATSAELLKLASWPLSPGR